MNTLVGDRRHWICRANARRTLLQVHLRSSPSHMTATAWGPPSLLTERKSEMIFRIYEGSLPLLHPTLLRCLFLKYLGFFSIVPHATGVSMSQSPAVTLLGPRKPFLRRMGSPGSHRGELSPWQLFWLLAVRNSPPTPLPHNLRSYQRVEAMTLILLCTEMVASGEKAYSESDALCSFHEVVWQGVLKK